MEIPIYIDGEKAGTLTITRQGSRLHLSAALRDPGRVVRLTAYGEREAYIGVPEPAGGALRLEKTLTAAETRLFPQEPAYAAEEKADNAAPPRHRIFFGGRPHFF